MFQFEFISLRGVFFVVVYKTVASFWTLFHKNNQMLVKNAKFGTNFGKPVKITLPQVCKQTIVGEIAFKKILGAGKELKH